MPMDMQKLDEALAVFENRNPVLLTAVLAVEESRSFGKRFRIARNLSEKD